MKRIPMHPAAAFLLASVFWLSCTQVVFATPIRDSLDFQNNAFGAGDHGSYEANVDGVFPNSVASSPRWGVTTSGSSTATVADGILSMDASASGGTTRNYFANGSAATNADNFWNVSDATGWTVEIRAQVHSAILTGGTKAAMNINSRSSATSGRLWLGDDDIFWNTGDVDDPFIYFSMDATEDFHVYRMAKHPGENRFSLWVDGQLFADDLPGVSTTTANLIFGDPGNGVRGAVDIDYVRWDKTGAFAPVPEPGGFTLMMFAFSTFGVFRRRRRRRRAGF